MILKMKEYPLLFYNYDKSYAINRADIGLLVKENDGITIYPKEMAVLLAAQSSSVFKTPRTCFITNETSNVSMDS